MPTAQELIDLLLSQEGAAYVFGAEADYDDPDPDAFDCSELVDWACNHLKVYPKMPDGSWLQFRHCRNHNTLIKIEDALQTRGALLFRIGHKTYGNHVAVSLGDGRTIEARGRKYGVGIFPARGRPWTHGALVPGLEY